MLLRPPEYLHDAFGAIKKKIDSDYTANQAIWQVYWTEATIDTRLEAGDTSLMSEINSTLPNNNKGQWYFNRVRPLCSMVSGHQRRNRKSTIVVPLENGDQHTADQWSKILLNVFKKEGVYDTISDAFYQGALVTGMNLLHVYLDFKDDPLNGDIKIDNCSYNSFFIDPYFRKPDLSDCAFVWRRTYLSHSAAAALMPEKDYDAVMSLQGNPTGTGRDGRFQYMPEAFGQTQQNRLAYDEYYYRDYRKQKLLVNKRTGSTRDVSDFDEIDYKTYLDHYPELTLVEKSVPTVRMAIMIQDKVFYDGPNSLNIDRYPFIPVIGYYNPMMPYFYSRIQGLCRSMRDPQMLLNRRIILSLDLAESVVNTGFIFKENTPVDVKHLFQTGQGRIIPIKQEANMTDIQQIQPPQVPPSFFTLQDTLSKEISLVSGINEELMGFNYDDKSGYRSALQQAAGLTTLEILFDRLDNSQNMLGDLMMDVIRNNYTPGKIQNILEGQQPAPLFYNKAFGKYHCAVEAGFNTQTQKQMQFIQLLDLKQAGIPVPDARLLDAATIQNKTEIIQEIQQQQMQAQQLQQMQAQSQIEETQARTRLANARSTADEGLGIERISRVAENQALAQERRAASVKDDQQALLNYVKALKEIEAIDFSQLEKIIQLQRLLKENNPPAQNVSESIRGPNLAGPMG